jgi:hypothetical protein
MDITKITLIKEHQNLHRHEHQSDQRIIRITGIIYVGHQEHTVTGIMEILDITKTYGTLTV